MSACPVCGIDADSLSVPDAVSTLKTLPRRFHEALTGPAEATVARAPDGAGRSMLDHAAHALTTLSWALTAMDGVQHHSHPTVPIPPPADGSATSREEVLAGIDRDASALAETASGMSREAWDRPIVVDGTERAARWIVQQAAHSGAHELREIADVRARVAPRLD